MNLLSLPAERSSTFRPALAQCALPVSGVLRLVKIGAAQSDGSSVLDPLTSGIVVEYVSSCFWGQPMKLATWKEWYSATLLDLDLTSARHNPSTRLFVTGGNAVWVVVSFRLRHRFCQDGPLFHQCPTHMRTHHTCNGGQHMLIGLQLFTFHSARWQSL